MKNSLKYIFSNLLVLGVAGSMFFAAGCPEESSCESDADCADSEVCSAEGTCEAPSNDCTDDSACTIDGEFCLGEGDNKTCRQPTDCSELADPSAYCANQITDFDATTQKAVCNAEKQCVAESIKEYRYVQVVDASEGSACSSTSGGKSDAGSDIVTIALLDDTGTTIGFGKVKEFTKGSGEPAYIDKDAVFNGMPRDQSFFDENGVCPAPTAGTMDRFRDDSVLSLGCQGEIIVEFLDSNGESIAIDATKHQIEVTEFGPYCSDKADPSDPNADFGTDKFATYLCTTLAGGAVASSDCAALLGTDGDQGYEVYELSTISTVKADPNAAE